MKYYLKKEQDIDKILNKFNHFHDSFIREILIKNIDHFDSNGRDCTGDFEISISFIHSNYDEGKHPYNQMIRAIFKSIKDINFDFRGIDPIEWDIEFVDIEQRREENFKDSYFTFNIILPQFIREESNKLGEKKYNLFLFKEAEFEELPSP